MNLEEDIREFVLKSLPHDPKFTAELQAKTAQELLVIYGNWRSRLVSMSPRQVHRSNVLMANPLSSDLRYKPGLDAIVAKLLNGQDVTPHLSRAIRYGYKPTNSGRNRQDLDLLLNDWGVHHLHLSTAIEADGFVARTGPLLFAVFRPDDAYLIDIIDHGGWTRNHVIETIVAEWPSENLVWEMKGVLPSGRTWSEAERKDLRNAHISSYLEIGGKLYMPAGGLTSAGTSVMNTMSVQRLFRTVRWFKDQLAKEPDFLKNAAAPSGITLPAEPDLHFEFFAEGGYGVVEKKTGLRFRLA
jgi:hypothetical protein